MVATEERVMTLLAQSNPVPDVDALRLDEMEGSRYLAAIDQRSTDVLDIDSRQESEPDTKSGQWTRWSLAAAGILMLGTLGLFILDGREGDVATGVAMAEQFAEAVSSGETDLNGLVTDDATFGPVTVALNDDLAAFWAGLDSELTLSSCEQTSQVVRCDYEWSDVIRRAQDRPEYGTLTFLIEDSSIASIARDWDQDASEWIDQGDPVIHYLQWLNQNHPDWDDGLTWIGEPTEIGTGYAPLAHDDPVHDATYATALTRYMDEYQQVLTTAGLEATSPCDITNSSSVSAVFGGSVSEGTVRPGGKCVYGIDDGAAVQVEVLRLGDADAWNDVKARYESTRGGIISVDGVGEDAFHPGDVGVSDLVFVANGEVYAVVALGGPTPETLDRLGDAVRALGEDIAGS